MKKLNFLTVSTLIAMVLLASCVSSPATGTNSAPRDGLPDFIRNARRNAPEDVLVATGSARMSTQSQSKVMAETRARAEIARAMESIVQDMVRDYQASSEVDPSAALAFQENITVTLSRSRLTGAVIVEEDWINGTYYVVMHLNRANVVREINQAQAAARLAVPAMASFNAEARMNEALERESRRELRFADSD